MGESIKIGNDLESFKKENKKLKEEVSKLNEEKRISELEKKQYFAKVSHDLRSPFNVILGFLNENFSQYIELGKNFDKLPKDELLKKFNEMKLNNDYAHESATNVFNLLESLLYLANIDRNKIDHKIKRINLVESINRVLNLLKVQAENKKINIQSGIDISLKIKSDIDIIEFVLRNLIANAIKFTPQNGSVTLLSLENKEFTTIIIKDTGVGIEKERLGELFNSFKSTNGTNGEKGTGLGLSTCKELVEKMGGSISVKSSVGKGTTFIIKLPKA